MIVTAKTAIGIEIINRETDEVIYAAEFSSPIVVRDKSFNNSITINMKDEDGELISAYFPPERI